MLEGCITVFVLGGPGSGKGTHCHRVKERMGWVHLSTGDLFRAEAERGTEQGVLLRDIMAEGGMVPVEITIGLLRSAMEASTVKRFLIDGFPRAMDQVDVFEQHVCRAEAVIFFDCPEDAMQARALQRTDGRADDNPETMRQRLAGFREMTVPVVEWFDGRGRLTRFDSNRPLHAVAADVDAFFKTLHERLGLPIESAGGVPGAQGVDLISFDDSDATEETSAPNAAGQDSAPAATAAGAGDVLAGGEAVRGAAAAPAAVEAVGAGELRPIVIIGPSGVGKGTLIARLMERHGRHFGFTVSHTTREARPGEVDGVHYHFTTRSAMDREIAAGGFLEHAEVHGNLYGTSIAAVHAVTATGKAAILDIDVQGARQIRAGPHGRGALLLFIAPPSEEELERRLRGRGTETEDRVQRRLTNARTELEASHEPGFVDTVIVNDDLSAAYGRLEAAIAAHVPGVMSIAGSSRGAAGAVTAAEASDAEDALAASAEMVAVDEAMAGTARAAQQSQPAVGPKQYLRQTVVPHVEAALLAVAQARPDDPLQFVIDHLIGAKL